MKLYIFLILSSFNFFYLLDLILFIYFKYLIISDFFKKKKLKFFLYYFLDLVFIFLINLKITVGLSNLAR
jgi:Trk-type K+ transport system membrane component